MPKEVTGNPRFNALYFGLLGGLAGAIIMGLVAYSTPPPNTGGDPFFIATVKLIGFGNVAWAVGWMLHVATGMIIGAIFGIAATRGPLRTRRLSDRLLAGVVVGLAAWIVLFVPMLLFLNPAAASVQSLEGGFVMNILFGLILVVVFAFGQSFVLIERDLIVYRCEGCGASFSTPEELANHKGEKHAVLDKPASA
jgi:uncharacterized OB-fold protein